MEKWHLNGVNTHHTVRGKKMTKSQIKKKSELPPPKGTLCIMQRATGWWWYIKWTVVA